MKRPQSKWTRRELLKRTVSALALSPVLKSFGGQEVRDPAGNGEEIGIIERENRRPGTLNWLIGRSHKLRPCPGRCAAIEGYCSHTSVEAGEEIQFFINTRNSSQDLFQLDIFRMGFYGGTGGRWITS